MTGQPMQNIAAAYGELSQSFDHLLTALNLAIAADDMQAMANVLDEFDSAPAALTAINDAAHQCLIAVAS